MISTISLVTISLYSLELYRVISYNAIDYIPYVVHFIPMAYLLYD